MKAWYIEEVDATVIGSFCWPYEFWRDGKRIAHGHFESDAEAEAWFKENYADEYRVGVEMRRFE